MPLSRDDITRLIDIEAQLQNVPTGLARAVAYHESGFDPQIEGDGGNSIGVFQLQKKAAIDAGIDPKERWDPAKNIFAGVRYLRQKLDQSGGKIDEALSRYNRGTPDYRGIGDPHYVERVKRYYTPEGTQPAPAPQPAQQPGLLARLGQALSPASAEAATPQAPARSRLEEIEAELARREQQAPPQAPPQAPGATTTLPPVSQTAPTPQTQPGASQRPGMRLSLGDPTQAATEPEARATIEAMRQRQMQQTPAMERFLALPSIAQLTPAEREQVQREFQALPPDQQEEVIQREVPQDLQQAMAQPPPPARKSLGVPDEAPLEESLTAPSTMIPLLMPGAGLKLVPGALKTAAPFLNRAVRAGAEGLSQTLGWTAGRTAETGEVPSPGEIGKEAALNVGTGGVVEIPAALRSAKNAVLRSTPGAQILLNQRAVQEAEGLGKRVFNAQDKAVVGKAFDNVAATGEKLDVTPVRDLWNSLTLAERHVAGNELNKISSTFADALKTRKLGDWDIGELQHLRSELRTASLSKRTPETQDLLQSLRASVDEAIANGMAKGSLPAAELIEAQKAYRKVMQAEDLQGLITKHTKDSPNLKWQELNLAALNKELRGGGTRRAQALLKGMDATEKQLLMQELDSLKRHYPFVQIPRQGATMAGTSAALAATGLALTGNLPAAAAVAVPAILAAAARSPNIMSLFKRSIIEGKGRLAQHHVDALLDAIRHESDGETPD